MELIGKLATAYEQGNQFGKGIIVFVCSDSIWLLLDSGFILKCDPNSIKVTRY